MKDKTHGGFKNKENFTLLKFTNKNNQRNKCHSVRQKHNKGN